MKNIIKLILPIATLCVAFASSAQALTIKYFTKVDGYNGGDWIEIVSGAPAAKPAKINGKWVTDRVERGKPLKIEFADHKAGQDFKCSEVYAVIRVDGKKAAEGDIKVPLAFAGRCTEDVNADNVVIKLTSNKNKNEHVTRRIPIGRR